MRDPQDDELAMCEAYIKLHIDAIKPKAIVIMHDLTAAALLGFEDKTLSQLRKKQYHYEGIPVFVTYPPKHLMSKSQDKALAWQDLKLIKSALSTH